MEKVMERLTNKKEADTQRRDYENRLKNGYPRSIPEERFLKLAAYEDTGLTPERAQELSQAEKDGRLVVLPCKNHESIFYIEDGDWYDDVPYDISIGQKQGEWNDSLLYECEDGFAFFAEDIGKTVFLTQEEAEAELERRVGESDETSDD